MAKIKIAIIILISATLVGLFLAKIVTANPFSLRERDFNFDRAKYVEDEIVVKFKGDLEPFRVIKIPKGEIGERIKEYLARRDVIYAEPNYIAYALMVPNDPYYKYQWHLDNPDYGGIQMEEAWDVSIGNSSVIVAIVDTGIAYENYGKYCQAPDLAQTCVVPGYDFVNNDSHPNDDNNHGTHVAGTIAQSTNNSLGVAGIAFNTCLMPVKVLNSRGSGTYTQVANGIRYAADNGAKVINLSLGGSSASQTLEDAVAYAYNKGVTIVAACGNDNSSSCSYPAAYNDYVIAIGATRYDETKAPYSSYGSSLDLVAPGGDTGVDQNNDGYADGVLQQTFKNSTYVCSFAYYFFQGTSMATPHVSGTAALLLAKGNATNPDQIRTALQETADDLGPAGRDNTYGWGLINAYSALNWTSAPQCAIDSDCDDGLYCNGIETCQAGVCKAGTLIECSGLGDQCNTGVCDEALDQCVVQPKPDGTACDDGLYCNTGETCQAGVCGGGSARTCDDGTACTTDSCNESLDKCENIWPGCGISDGCCGPTCTWADDQDCSQAVKCWDGTNQYLYRAADQFRKFCKCAQGTYGYNSYKYSWGTKIVWKYIDPANNENWAVSSQNSYVPVYQVTCTDGKAYPTNQDYYWPK
ncbi:MAG: S8 family peptidase [Patescibacteria group bacterium]